MVLWGRLLLQLGSIVEATGTSSLILVITSIQAIEWMGEYCFSSSSSTEWFPNIDISEVIAFITGNPESKPPILMEKHTLAKIPIVTMTELQGLSLYQQDEVISNTIFYLLIKDIFH
ncbi:unnamed protein product, partial [Linum tenue]